MNEPIHTNTNKLPADRTAVSLDTLHKRKKENMNTKQILQFIVDSCETLRTFDAWYERDENGKPTGWHMHCKHGTNIGHPWGRDYLCPMCEDGMSDKEYELRCLIATQESILESYREILLNELGKKESERSQK